MSLKGILAKRIEEGASEEKHKMEGFIVKVVFLWETYTKIFPCVFIDRHQTFVTILNFFPCGLLKQLICVFVAGNEHALKTRPALNSKTNAREKRQLPLKGIIISIKI